MLRPFLFFQFHFSINAFVYVYPCTPVLVVYIGVVEAVVTTAAHGTHERGTELHLSAKDHILCLVCQPRDT